MQEQELSPGHYWPIQDVSNQLSRLEGLTFGLWTLGDGEGTVPAALALRCLRFNCIYTRG